LTLLLRRGEEFLKEGVEPPLRLPLGLVGSLRLPFTLSLRWVVVAIS